MFKLVGQEHFTIKNAKCVINIEAVSGFSYEYSLEVNNKPLKKFLDNQSKIMRTWTCSVGGEDTRIVLGKSIFMRQEFFYFFLLTLITLKLSLRRVIKC